MNSAKTTPEALDAFALELQEVEWFGKPAVDARPARRRRLVQFLAAVGGTTAALLPVLSRG